MAKIKSVVANTPEELAQILNLPPQRAHSEVSTDLLIRILGAAGYRVDVQVTKSKIAT
jgi:hypothetical protein